MAFLFTATTRSVPVPHPEQRQDILDKIDNGLSVEPPTEHEIQDAKDDQIIAQLDEAIDRAGAAVAAADNAREHANAIIEALIRARNEYA